MRKLIPFALVLLTALLFLAVPAQAQACDYGVAQVRLATVAAYDYAPAAIVEEVRVQRIKQVQQIRRVEVQRIEVKQVQVKQVQQIQRVRTRTLTRTR